MQQQQSQQAATSVEGHVFAQQQSANARTEMVGKEIKSAFKPYAANSFDNQRELGASSSGIGKAHVTATGGGASGSSNNIIALFKSINYCLQLQLLCIL